MLTSRIQFSLLNILRFIAFAGTLFALIYEIFSVKTLRLNQHYSFYALAFIALSVGVSLFVLRKTVLPILKNLDLLVPIGIYISVDFLIGFLNLSSTFIGFQNGRFNWNRLTFSIVVTAILQLFVAVCFTGWMTRVLLRFVQTEKVELFHSFKNIKWWFPRTFAVVLLGWTPINLFIFFIPFLYSRSSDGRSALFLFVIFIGAFSLFWNILTSAVLPNVLWNTTNLVRAIIDGFILSWKNKIQIVLPVVLLMFACGWITFISVTYQMPENAFRFGESRSYQSNLRMKSYSATNFVWTSDYPKTSNWHKDLMKTVEEEPLSSVNLRIKILILFLSLVVSLTIINKLFGNGKIDADEFPHFNKYLFSNNRIVIPVLAVVAVLFPFELIKRAILFPVSEESAMSKFSDLKVFSGEDFFSKSEFFYFGKNAPSGDGALKIDQLLDFSVLGDKSDVIISGNKNALVFDKNGNFKEEIKFNLGKRKGSPTVDSTFNKLEVFDIENDGKYEFAGLADYPYVGVLLNNKGDIIWRFEDAKRFDSLKKVSVKDVDGDKEKEIIVEDQAVLKFFSLDGAEKFSRNTTAEFLTENSALIDVDEDGKDEIITTGYSNLQVRKLKEDSMSKVEIPYTQNGYLIGENAKPLIVFFDKNILGLFDFKGNLIEKYSAPLSFIEKEKFLRKENDYSSQYYVRPFSARAFKVKLKQDKPEHLAVLVTLATETDASLVDMLYVYDENGELVYQESTGGKKHLMQKLPLENGTEGLLIQKEDSIQLYKAN